MADSVQHPCGGCTSALCLLDGCSLNSTQTASVDTLNSAPLGQRRPDDPLRLAEALDKFGDQIPAIGYDLAADAVKQALVAVGWGDVRDERDQRKAAEARRDDLLRRLNEARARLAEVEERGRQQGDAEGYRRAIADLRSDGAEDAEIAYHQTACSGTSWAPCTCPRDYRTALADYLEAQTKPAEVGDA